MAIVLVMFADVLLSPKAIVLSQLGTDAHMFFIPWREFGFQELRQGNLALWNPYVVSGCPFFGSFQSAMLYPCNWPYLVLPIDRAINVDIVLHVLLGGLFQFAWMSYRGLSPLASLVSAVLLMFGAPFFFHLYPGHLTPLAVMAWAPLVLLACDGLAAKPSLGWCLLGALAVAMQILAGYPQMFFYTLIAAGLYSLLTLTVAEQRFKALAGVAVMYLGGGALGAVQLVTGLAASGDGVRGDRGLPYDVASSYSLPPENAVTWLAPGFFGDMDTFPYWGRWYLWEMSLFMGVTGFVLAIGGVLFAPREARRPARVALAMACVMLVLALGDNTPLFKFLYAYVPGFNTFRSISKFIFPASLFLTLLAGCGFDYLLQTPRRVKSLTLIALAVAALTAAGGLGVYVTADGAWAKVPAAIAATGQFTLPKEVYSSPGFAAGAGMQAGGSLLFASGVAALLSALVFFAAREKRGAVLGIAGLAVLEVFVWGWQNRPTFDLAAVRAPVIEQFVKEHPGNYRTVNTLSGNFGMSIPTPDIGGYEPFVSRRYAEFVDFTQGRNLERADSYVTVSDYHPLYGLLRCRYVFLIENNAWRVGELKGALPHLLLMQDYAVMEGRDRILEAMARLTFDPQRQMILEQEPDPKPGKSNNPGTANVVDSSTDHLTIEAELTDSAILLITDIYRQGWSITGLPGSTQSKYEILPANYILRAVPLAAGTHRLRLEYAPPAFSIGKWMSVTALVVYLALAGWQLKRWRREKVSAPSGRSGKVD